MILEGKWTKYVILILLLSTIHGSALILLLVYFLRNVKPWGSQMRMVMFLSLIAGVGFDKLFPLFGNFWQKHSIKVMLITFHHREEEVVLFDWQLQ